MALGIEDVKRIAKLARLALSEDEIVRYQSQMTKILDSMAELSKAETDGVNPTSSAAQPSGGGREDKAEIFSDPEKILSLAPDREGPYFKVKKIIGA
ncbi:MAG: Asp-tRNA(Asn)/Glu-tRNA(Gln) amidotransferase subunit GatC [Elusimicrobiota bacterium]